MTAPADIDIRRIGPRDGALFDRVANGVFDDPVLPSRLAAYVAEPGHHLYVAISGGEIVGQCAAVLHRHPDKASELYIDEVGVAPAFRRHGIGGALLQAMMDLGRKLGCAEAWLGTEPDNGPARLLYERSREKRKPAETFVMYVYEL